MIKLSHVKPSAEAAEAVKKLILDGKIGQTEIIEEFEEKFARWIGSKYAIAVSSGTMADTIALAVLKHFNPEKNKVLVPALTFIAQVNSVIYNGLTPVFYETNEEIVFRKDTLCIFPVHLLGKPSRNSFVLVPEVEDACEAIGSKLFNKKCGTKGDLGTFSFFPSHAMTTGEGGMIVTDNEIYALLARRLRNHGKLSSTTFHFNVIGFNGKMTSMQAMLGIHALDEIDDVIEKRRKAYFALGGKESDGEFISPHAFPVICESEKERNQTMIALNRNGIECRNLFSCIPTQEEAYSYLGHKLGEFPISEDIGNRGLYVPCHQGLSDEDIGKIKEILNAQKEAAREVLTV